MAKEKTLSLRGIQKLDAERRRLEVVVVEQEKKLAAFWDTLHALMDEMPAIVEGATFAPEQEDRMAEAGARAASRAIAEAINARIRNLLLSNGRTFNPPASGREVEISFAEKERLRQEREKEEAYVNPQ